MAQTEKVREAVGLFDDYDELQGTIRELGVSGFGRHEISVLGNELVTAQRLDTPRVDPELLEDNPAAPRSANITEEEVGVAQGVLMGAGMLVGIFLALLASSKLTVFGAVLCTMFAGVGGLAIGALLAEYLGEQYAQFFRRQVERGGLLLWVRTRDRDKERKARRILEQHGAHDVHLHELPLSD